MVPVHPSFSQLYDCSLACITTRHVYCYIYSAFLHKFNIIRMTICRAILNFWALAREVLILLFNKNQRDFPPLMISEKNRIKSGLILIYYNFCVTRFSVVGFSFSPREQNQRPAASGWWHGHAVRPGAPGARRAGDGAGGRRLQPLRLDLAAQHRRPEPVHRRQQLAGPGLGPRRRLPVEQRVQDLLIACRGRRRSHAESSIRTPIQPDDSEKGRRRNADLFFFFLLLNISACQMPSITDKSVCVLFSVPDRLVAGSISNSAAIESASASLASMLFSSFPFNWHHQSIVEFTGRSPRCFSEFSGRHNILLPLLLLSQETRE